MKLHANAALSFRQRERMVCRVVDEGWSLRDAALAAEVSTRTAGKWVGRYRAEGAPGLLDRSSAPLLSRTAVLSRRSRRSRRCGVCGSPALRSLRFSISLSRPSRGS